jgi:hypothetical protein
MANEEDTDLKDFREKQFELRAKLLYGLFSHKYQEVRERNRLEREDICSSRHLEKELTLKEVIQDIELYLPELREVR